MGRIATLVVFIVTTMQVRINQTMVWYHGHLLDIANIKGHHHHTVLPFSSQPTFYHCYMTCNEACPSFIFDSRGGFLTQLRTFEQL